MSGRIGCTGGIAVLVASGAPRFSVYALAVGASVFGAVFRPAEASLVPLVARSPQELTAANVAASTFDSIGVFVGPALGAFLIAFSGYTAAFAVIAATFAWSALFVLRISSGDARAPAGAAGGRGRARRRRSAVAARRLSHDRRTSLACASSSVCTTPSASSPARSAC